MNSDRMKITTHEDLTLLSFFNKLQSVFSEFENHASVVIVGSDPPLLPVAAVPTTPSCCSFDSSRMDDDVTKRSLMTDSAKSLLH